MEQGERGETVKVHIGNFVEDFEAWSLKSLSTHLTHLRLHSIHGNRWVTIGKAIGVSGRAAQDKFRSMAKRQKKGDKSCSIRKA